MIDKNRVLWLVATVLNSYKEWKMNEWMNERSNEQTNKNQWKKKQKHEKDKTLDK